MILQRGIEAIRREAMAKTQAKLKEQTNYQSKVDAMSKHNVGGMYDLRAIAKSKQFKEQQNYFDDEKAEKEVNDFLHSENLYKFGDYVRSFIKELTGKNATSYEYRVTGKFLSHFANELKVVNNIKTK